MARWKITQHSDKRDREPSLSFDDTGILREVVGELGLHLKLISETLGVELKQRGNTVYLRSAGGSVDLARQVLEELYALVERGHALHPADVRHGIRILASDPSAKLNSFFGDLIVMGVKGRPICPRSEGQREYVCALRKHDIVFGVGPAGTGKTYLAMAMAVAALQRKEVRRVVLTRPAVEAGEKLGFLPGDLTEKVDPYLRPLYDALQDMVQPDRIARLLERQTFEVAPLGFMRGRTLNDAYVVLDEAQNTTIEQMRMFLTRLGDRAKMVITGDITQVDLPPNRQSGMAQALNVLRDVSGIGVVHLSAKDVVRHPLVADIIEAYEAEDCRRRTREKQ
ncbi:MAG: PhoH family protein [Proteobacteria bacterium]|jgi:phosphate starvation-inducible protein PhoH and related proteins|nr:PhoH family protein [Pseudomonadota bacterium]